MSQPIITAGEIDQVWETINILSTAITKQSEAVTKFAELVTIQSNRIAELERKLGITQE